ncbi:MAG TPA: UDP-N-acetylmuramate--L-alanine ligase, partial [Candidatus Syntrophosphaera sp.]|nr:UDP-N-acetylmuramate--L-alanine ligase [Candidatus Syntrophosphaera sp.]
LILAPIYPAREEPIPGVSSKLIADIAVQSGHPDVVLIENDADIVPKTLSLLKKDDILITMGAGNIWQYGEEILAKLKKPVDKNIKPKKVRNLET